MNKQLADGLSARAGAPRMIVKERPDADPGPTKARNTLISRAASSICRSAAQADRRRHLGRHGHRHGLCHRRCDRDRQAGARRRGDSAFGFSGMEVETIAATSRRSASSSSTMTGSIAAPMSIRRLGPRDDRLRQGLALRQDDGGVRGVGVHVTTPTSRSAL